MSDYTDAKGVKYSLHPSHTSGDIALLSETKIAFRTDKAKLRANSSVFRDMFDNESVTGSEIHLSATGATINLFLDMSAKPGIPPTWTNDWGLAITSIEFARQYDCDAVARDILYTFSKVDSRAHRLEAFTIACDLEHLPAVCRQLSLASYGESGQGGAMSLRPLGGHWTPTSVRRVSPLWFWALNCAVEVVEKRPSTTHLPTERKTGQYWSAVIGEFMIHVTTSEVDRIKSREIQEVWNRAKGIHGGQAS